MDITIQNASVQDMDRLLKMIDGMSDEPAQMSSDDDAPMGGGCSVCGGDDHDDHNHPHDDASPAPSPCGGDDEPADNTMIMRKHMGMLANAANEVEERLGNAPANTNDGAPDVKGDTHTDFSIRGATKNHHATTISGDNPLDDIKESDMFERYNGFTGRNISIDLSKKKDELDEAPPAPPAPIAPKPPAPNATGAAVQAKQAVQATKTPPASPTQGPAGAPAPVAPAPVVDPKVVQQAKAQADAAKQVAASAGNMTKVMDKTVQDITKLAPTLGMDPNKDPDILQLQKDAGIWKQKVKDALEVGQQAGAVAKAPAGPAGAPAGAPATQVGYKAGQVDPRLAQAAAGAPAPAAPVA